MLEAFVAGILVPLVVWGVGRRIRPKRRAPVVPQDQLPPNLPGEWIPAKTIGVYGEVETTDGRRFKTIPAAIRIDCEIIHFSMKVDAPPFDGALALHHIHLGTSTTTTKIDPPVPTTKNDHSVSIHQPVRITELSDVGGPLPDWAQW